MIIAISVTVISVGNFSIGFVYLIILIAGGTLGAFIHLKSYDRYARIGRRFS